MASRSVARLACGACLTVAAVAQSQHGTGLAAAGWHPIPPRLPLATLLHSSWGRQPAALAGSMVPGLRTAKPAGTLAASAAMTITLNLKVRDEVGLQLLLHNLYDSRSPSYHHFITPQEFARRFAPTAADRGSMGAWLRTHHLQVKGTSSNGMQITASGTSAAIQSAFGVHLGMFMRGSQRLYANTTPVEMPRALLSEVAAVGGLTNAVREHRSPLVVRHSAGDPNPEGYTPQQLLTAYDMQPMAKAGITGAGQTVALVEFSDFNPNNVSMYSQNFGLSVPTVQKVQISDGISQGAPLDDGEPEAEMDIELVHALAPAANLLVYEAPQGLGPLKLYNQIVSDNRAKVISCSWGTAEDHQPASFIKILDGLFQEAAAQGQTILAASGDDGAYDAASMPDSPEPSTLMVDFPASDPWVTAVGGTSLAAGTDGTYSSERSWADTTSSPGHPSGGGGGVSTVFPRPSWQTGVGTDNRFSTGKRQVPDVSAEADPRTGYLIYTTDMHITGWEEAGGTSASAPLWAAYIALVNQQRQGSPLGFLNPTLYSIANTTTDTPAPFHDITVGDNLYYPATPGWDFATGWGSLDGMALAKALSSALPVSAPPATPGQPVTTPSPVPTAQPTQPPPAQEPPAPLPTAPPVVSVPTTLANFTIPAFHIVPALSTDREKSAGLSQAKAGDKVYVDAFVHVDWAYPPGVAMRAEVYVARDGQLIATTKLVKNLNSPNPSGDYRIRWSWHVPSKSGKYTLRLDLTVANAAQSATTDLNVG